MAVNLGDGEALEQREVRFCAERGGVARLVEDDERGADGGGARGGGALCARRRTRTLERS